MSLWVTGNIRLLTFNQAIVLCIRRMSAKFITSNGEFSLDVKLIVTGGHEEHYSPRAVEPSFASSIRANVQDTARR